jgi:hypothetical protein
MNFGELKSKIEVCLSESYKKNNLKKDLFVFNELVLKNKNISKIFFLYDELSKNKGLSESIANEYINGSITAYENTVNKISLKEIKELKYWIGHIICENEYKNIDNLFSTNFLVLENKIKSKKLISENLRQTEKEVKDVINIPLKSMVNVANKTVKNFISSLNESEQKELNKILSTPKNILVKKYDKIKDDVKEKLGDRRLTESDDETVNTIDKVLDRLQTESFNELNLYKLIKLSDSL